MWSLILLLAFLFLRSHLLLLPPLSLLLHLALALLSAVLEAATWSSASVFTSFYLSDVQFSSSVGFSLGPVVAAGAVV